MDQKLTDLYVKILEEELLPAMGCTEPIAIAYGSALTRDLLGEIPQRVEVTVSGNLVKNAKSVTVPNTGGLRGIEAAVAAGIIAGDANKTLEVISSVSEEQVTLIRQYLSKNIIEVELGESPFAFDYTVKAYYGDQSAEIRIANAHTNVVRSVKNGKIVFDSPIENEHSTGLSDHGCLTVEKIVEFADTVDLDRVKPLLLRQIEYNVAIAEEGLRGDWGACIGQTLLKSGCRDFTTTAKAYAAAGSDARMNGCALPVVIVSGSGNQGITASLPVICYAKERGADEDSLLRALLVANLVTIHLKTDIGRLSAFCGAVCAGAGAGAGICYLDGGKFLGVAHTVVNALAISSGLVCDGAKASCAGKIALSVEAGIMGWNMYKNGKHFEGGDGIVSKGVERTIRNVGFLGHDGMKITDKTILEIMLAEK